MLPKMQLTRLCCGKIGCDNLETVRLADLRVAKSNPNNAEPEIEALCQTYGTTTEGAFRSALLGLDLVTLLAFPELNEANRAAVTSWRRNV